MLIALEGSSKAEKEIMSYHLIATHLQLCALSWERPVQNRKVGKRSKLSVLFK